MRIGQGIQQVLLTATLLVATTSAAHAQDADRVVAEGEGLRITTGPAATYWRPGEPLTGDYTIRATFTELEYMALNNHPHPYGIVIAGNEMGTDRQSFLYCMAYGNGRFIVRGGVVECAINGTVVARYDRAELVTEGRLASTDGVYGLRFGHNTDVVVRGLTIER